MEAGCSDVASAAETAMRDDWTGEREEGPVAAPGDESSGFRRAGRRALTPAERRVVRNRSRWLWLQSAGAALGFWIVFLFALGTGVLIEEAQGSSRFTVTAVTILLFAGTIALFLAARSFLRESRALGQDARRGYVQRFTGVLPPPEAIEPRLQSVLEVGLLKRDRATPQWFEVLPHSGFLWQANGARPRRWIPLMPPMVVELAETPAFARIAAEWAEPVAGAEAPVRVGQRELSPDEVRELRQQLRRALWVRLAWVIPCTAWFGTVVVLGIREGHLPQRLDVTYFHNLREFLTFFHDIAALLVLSLATILGNVALIRGLREAWMHAREAQIGQVVIVRRPLEDEEAPEEAPTAWVTLELLPVSEAVWTIDGEPAGWRRAG
jgi:hypothetical protein